MTTSHILVAVSRRGRQGFVPYFTLSSTKEVISTADQAHKT